MALQDNAGLTAVQVLTQTTLHCRTRPLQNLAQSLGISDVSTSCNIVPFSRLATPAWVPLAWSSTPSYGGGVSYGGMGSDTTDYRLHALQRRDITPEDYALLLELDEKVEKKCLTESQATGALKPCPAARACEMCVVCQEQLTETDAVMLGCEHVFHRECIVQWLTTSSTCCPLDSKPVLEP